MPRAPGPGESEAPAPVGGMLPAEHSHHPLNPKLWPSGLSCPNTKPADREDASPLPGCWPRLSKGHHQGSGDWLEPRQVTWAPTMLGAPHAQGCRQAHMALRAAETRATGQVCWQRVQDGGMAGNFWLWLMARIRGRVRAPLHAMCYFHSGHCKTHDPSLRPQLGSGCTVARLRMGICAHLCQRGFLLGARPQWPLFDEKEGLVDPSLPCSTPKLTFQTANNSEKSERRRVWPKNRLMGRNNR